MYGHNAGQPVSSLYPRFHNRDVDYVEQKKIFTMGLPVKTEIGGGKMKMRWPGIEPGSVAWRATVLPLHQ